MRLDQDGKERKQNFKLCNIETAGGKCFSEGAAGPIGACRVKVGSLSIPRAADCKGVFTCVLDLPQECSASLSTVSSAAKGLWTTEPRTDACTG